MAAFEFFPARSLNMTVTCLLEDTQLVLVNLTGN